MVFYDGDCPLCAAFVQWIAAHDRRGRFFFASNQGATARRHSIALPPERSAWSLSVIVAGNTYIRSEAVPRAIAEVGGGWRLATVLSLVPRTIRDAVYPLVARNRPPQRCLVRFPELERRLLPTSVRTRNGRQRPRHV